MEYEILKLQYVEMHEQTGQSLSVKYRFPIHFIHRVYCIGSRKFFHKTGHFVRQLKKYVFLGFKHWEMQPSDIFVLCHELINLINYLISLHKPESF